jgi:hypothetical protein
VTALLDAPASAPAVVDPDAFIYRGVRRGGTAVVLLEHGGRPTHQLRHVVRHSPTGLEWGYAGSGPADLARSLLLDALADQSKCPACGGTGRVVWLPDAADPVPWDPANAEHAALDENEGGLVVVDEQLVVERCFDCDGDGWRAVPYQDFKFEIVAGLPRNGWTLTRQTVVDWLTAHGVTA